MMKKKMKQQLQSVCKTVGQQQLNQKSFGYFYKVPIPEILKKYQATQDKNEDAPQTIQRIDPCSL